MNIRKTAVLSAAVLLVCLLSPVSAKAPARGLLRIPSLSAPDAALFRTGVLKSACLVHIGDETVRTESVEAAAAALARIDEAVAFAAEKNGLNSAPVRLTEVTWEQVLIPASCAESILSEDALFRAFSSDGGALSLSYACYGAETEAAVLPYQTEYRENDASFDGVHTMISPGENGLACVVWNIVYDPATGKETGRTERSCTVVKNPVNAVYYKGNFPLSDASVCTGEYAWPLPDNDQYLHRADFPDGNVPRGMTIYISSLYGGRDLNGVYDFHLGLDIAAPYRTPITACDGGVVVYSHYSDSYGYAVRIRHADGIETLYAHLNQRMVKDGDIVRKGELIGYVGNSGSASGYHLHLEFRRDHVTCDPSEFITVPDNVETVIW